MKNVMARIIGQSVKPAKTKPKAAQNEPGLDAAESARYHVLFAMKRPTHEQLQEYLAFRVRINAAEAEQKRAATAQAKPAEPEPGSAEYYSRYHFSAHIRGG